MGEGKLARHARAAGTFDDLRRVALPRHAGWVGGTILLVEGGGIYGYQRAPQQKLSDNWLYGYQAGRQPVFPPPPRY